MRTRSLLNSVLGLVLLFVAGWFSDGTSFGQVRIAREAIVDVSDLHDILRAGQQLESQQRWGEALTHYEEALRRHPGSPHLVQRHFLARLHYDVGRRYNDTSFVNTLAELDTQQALDLYSEILLKIHTYYVDQPDWEDLVRRGSVALEVALAEDRFRRQHRLAVGGEDAPDNSNILSGLSRSLEQIPVRSRHDARRAVMQTAYATEREIGIPAQVVVLEYACAAASSLDDYSSFLTGSQLDEVLSQIEGNFVGLGIELKAASNSLLIVDVIRGGPADQAGIRPGERIVRVDGHSTTEVSTDVAADMLKGKEGSLVELVVENASRQPRLVKLVRRRVDVPSIEQAAIIDTQSGVAYLHLSSFQKTTSEDLESTLWRLHGQGMRSLILDVRGNPGGLLSAAVDVADKFIARGGIVSTRGRSSGEMRDYQAHYGGTWRVPLVVLIDGESASASEIFAGAIRDHRRGVVVGRKSFGKGSVQGIFPLGIANIGIRLTTAKFYSPNGQPISRNGIDPDVPVHAESVTTARATDDGQLLASQPQVDPVLDRGLQVARQRLE